MVLFVAEKSAVGHTGIHCKQPCSYPFYGSGCQQVCLCPTKRCDISTGCQSLQNSKCLHLSEPTCYFLFNLNSFHRHLLTGITKHQFMESISTEHGFVQMFVSTLSSVTASERKGKCIRTFRSRHFIYIIIFF